MSSPSLSIAVVHADQNRPAAAITASRSSTHSRPRRGARRHCSFKVATPRAPTEERQPTGPEDPVPFVAEIATAAAGELLGAEDGSPVSMDNEAAFTDGHRPIPSDVVSLFSVLFNSRCEQRVVGHGQRQHVTNTAHAPLLPNGAGVPHTPCSRFTIKRRELPRPTAFLYRDPVRKGMRGSPGRQTNGTPAEHPRLAGYHLRATARIHLGDRVGHRRRLPVQCVQPSGERPMAAGAADRFRARDRPMASRESGPGSTRSGPARYATPHQAW